MTVPRNSQYTPVILVNPTDGAFYAASGSGAAAASNLTQLNSVALTTFLPVSPPLLTTSDLTSLRITNAAASGDTTLVAATAAQSTRVYALRISVAGATVVQLKDGSTVLEVFNFSANGGSVVLDMRSRPYYIGTVNTAFVLNSSLAVQVDGLLEYVKS